MIEPATPELSSGMAERSSGGRGLPLPSEQPNGVWVKISTWHINDLGHRLQKYY